MAKENDIKDITKNMKQGQYDIEFTVKENMTPNSNPDYFAITEDYMTGTVHYDGRFCYWKHDGYYTLVGNGTHFKDTTLSRYYVNGAWISYKNQNALAFPKYEDSTFPQTNEVYDSNTHNVSNDFMTKSTYKSSDLNSHIDIYGILNMSSDAFIAEQFLSVKLMTMTWSTVKTLYNPKTCYTYEKISQTKLYGIIITENKDYAIDYADNGVIPPDAVVHENPQDAGDNSKPDMSDSEGNDGANHDDIHNTPLNIPQNNALSSNTVGYYIMSASELTNFINWFWSNGDDWTDAILNSVTGLYNNLSQCILGITYFPWNLNSICNTVTDTVTIGRLNSEVTAPRITGIKAHALNSSIKIEEKYESFLDYAPYTEIYLYLAYYGVTELPTSLVMGRTLTVVYSIDVATGHSSIALMVNGALFKTLTCKVGTEIPFSLSSSLEMQTALVKGAERIGMGVATGGGMLGVAGDIMGGAIQVPSLNINSQTGEGVSAFLPQQCHIIRKMPNYYRPNYYGKLVGYPIQKGYKLSQCSGFTVVDEPKLALNGNMTQAENDEIKTLLQKGVYI